MHRAWRERGRWRQVVEGETKTNYVLFFNEKSTSLPSVDIKNNNKNKNNNNICYIEKK